MKDLVLREEKDLLLRDLYARLPYNIKVRYRNGNAFTLTSYHIDGMICALSSGNFVHKNFVIYPYLRPLSSITDEEKQELYSWGDYEMISWISDEEICLKDLTLSYELLTKLIDWLNEHHFDYRGLIGKGLALEAPTGMYKVVV